MSPLYRKCTQALLQTTGTDDDCSLGRAFVRQKSDDRVGHLNTMLARGGGNLNDPIFKSSNARGLPRKGGGCRSFDLIGALGPVIWSKLDKFIRSSESLDIVKKRIKTVDFTTLLNNTCKDCLLCNN